MAHFSLNHMASGTLVSSGIQRVIEDDRSFICAKRRRLSRPNTKEELRLKKQRRRKRRRDLVKTMSKKEASSYERLNLVKKLQEKARKELEEIEQYAKEQRQRALCFWKMWREERNKQSANSQPHQINRENIRSATTQEVLGEGIFGYCQKKLYRGHKVAVKYYKKSTINEVHNEAAHIYDCDHPGLPYVFGVCTDKKPYILVMEYYGINGKSTTIAEALRTKLITDQIGWAKVLLYCCKAIAHIHSKGKVHCDLKGDNIVLHEVDGNILPVIIDFGKMRRKCDCKVKKLSLSDQEHYRKHHKHIAPEIVRGTHPPSEASDIYAFGLIVSLVCHYNNKFEDLRLIAVRCIHGTPEKRPDIDNIIDKLCCIVN